MATKPHTAFIVVESSGTYGAATPYPELFTKDEREGEEVPEGLTGVAAGEVEVDARGAFADTTADLEQAQAQCVELE